MSELLGAAAVEQAATVTDVGVEDDGAADDDRFRPGWVFWTAVCWLALLVAVTALADVLPLADPLRPDPRAAAQGPSAGHWLGTDALGRDLLSRIVFGGRISMLVAFFSVVVAATIGMLLGLVAGSIEGRGRGLIMGVLDIMLAFPALVLAMAMTAFLGASARNVGLVIAFVAVPVFGRMAQAQTLTFSKREFVTASRASGATSSRTLFTEILPNVIPPILAFALLFAAVAIVIEGGLSFLGLGVPPPDPSWGGIIAGGQAKLDQSPHISLIPAAVMFLTVLALNIAGDGVRVHFDSAGGGRG
jgi:peptide/nickel transport system permease protein